MHLRGMWQELAPKIPLLLALAAGANSALEESLLLLMSGTSHADYEAGKYGVMSRGPAVVKELRLLLKHKDPSIRAGALLPMTFFPDESAEDVRPIMASLADGEAEVVVQALELLQLLGEHSKPAIPTAARLLEKPRWRHAVSSVPHSVAQFLGAKALRAPDSGTVRERPEGAA